MAGGSEDNYFARIIARGARDAARDLGVDLTLYWSNWDSDTMLFQFKQAIDSQADGIAIMGHPGGVSLGPFVAEARRKGIVVSSLNVNLPQIENHWISEGFGYVGQDVTESGRRLARQAIVKFHITSRTKVAVLGVRLIPGRGLRTASIISEFITHGISPEYLDFSPEIGNDQLLTKRLGLLFSGKPDWDVIIVDINTSVFLKAYRNSNLPPERYQTASFDLSPDIVMALQNGYIDLVIDQQPYLQGYLAVLQLCLSKGYGFSGLHILTDASVLDKDSVTTIEGLVKAGIR